jgi:hypothetical protein
MQGIFTIEWSKSGVSFINRSGMFSKAWSESLSELSGMLILTYAGGQCFPYPNTKHLMNGVRFPLVLEREFE